MIKNWNFDASWLHSRPQGAHIHLLVVYSVPNCVVMIGVTSDDQNPHLQLLELWNKHIELEVKECSAYLILKELEIATHTHTFPYCLLVSLTSDFRSTTMHVIG